MAIEKGWWTLQSTVELSDADLEHIAAMILKGFAEGEVLPSEAEAGYVEHGTLTVDAEELFDAEQIGPAYLRRFIRRLANDDIAVIEIAYYALHGEQHTRHLGKSTRYVVCSDPDKIQSSMSWERERREVVPIPAAADASQARRRCSLIDPTTLTWNGRPFLIEPVGSSQ